jgi:hypothetical protein
MPGAERVYRTTATGTGGLRAASQIRAFFGDFELVEPGLTWLDEWRPDQGAPVRAPAAAGEPGPGFLAGVGRKAS